MLKIFILEDNKDILEVLKLTLCSEYELTIAETISEAQAKLEQQKHDLYLLDWMLPDGEGVHLCAPIKELAPTSKVIMVTALNQPSQIIKGLDLGADDYITKPFDINILKARIRAHLRQTNQSNLITFKTLEIDSEQRVCNIDKELINLTKNEFVILYELIANIDRVCSRESLVQATSGENVFVTERTIDTHITSVRKKLKDYAKNIKTVRGIGYRFMSEIRN